MDHFKHVYNLVDLPLVELRPAADPGLDDVPVMIGRNLQLCQPVSGTTSGPWRISPISRFTTLMSCGNSSMHVARKKLPNRMIRASSGRVMALPGAAPTPLASKWPSARWDIVSHWARPMLLCSTCRQDAKTPRGSRLREVAHCTATTAFAALMSSRVIDLPFGA